MSYVLTAIARTQKFPQGTIDAVKTSISNLSLKVSKLTTLSAEKAVDFEIELADSDFQTVKNQIKALDIPGTDLIFQKNTSARKVKKLAVFDMDSTLIQQEVIELIAAQAHVEEEVAAITRSAMNGELDFKQSLAKRVGLLKGIESEHLWNDLKPQLTFTPGVRDLCKFLKRKGCKMAVFSGGFIPLANYAKEQLGLDYAFANVLGTETNKNGVEVLSGTTIGEVVDGQKKKEFLTRIAAEHGIPLADSVATGDGANDLPMMKTAGFGIAWNAKPKVQQEAPCCLNSGSLRDSLYIYGYTDEEIESVLAD